MNNIASLFSRDKGPQTSVEHDNERMGTLTESKRGIATTDDQGKPSRDQRVREENIMRVAWSQETKA